MTEDLIATEDLRSTATTMKTLLAKHPEWQSITVGGKTVPVGIAYDGRTNLFSSTPLALTGFLFLLFIFFKLYIYIHSLFIFFSQLSKFKKNVCFFFFF